MSIPKWFSDEANAAIKTFLWKNGRARIQNDVLIKNYSEGGLRNIHFDTFVKTQKIMWIQRLVDKQNTFSFAYLTSFLPKMKFNEILSSSFNSKSLNKDMPTFYKDILTHWFDIRRKPIDTMDIVDEVIWYNRNIVIDNSMKFYPNFYAKNI